MTRSPESWRAWRVPRLSTCIPYLLTLAGLALGALAGLAHIGVLAGGLAGGVFAMFRRSDTLKRIAPRWHVLWTMLLGPFGGSFLLGHAKTWKSFAVQVVLLIVPVPILVASMFAPLMPQLRDQVTESLEQLETYQAHSAVIEKRVSAMLSDFDDRTLVQLGDMDVSTASLPGYIRNDPLAETTLRLSLAPARAMLSEPGITTVFDKLDAILEADRAIILISPSAIIDGTRAADAFYEETLGEPVENISAEERAGIGDPPGPELAMMTCLVSDTAGRTVSYSAGGLYVDPAAIEELRPLARICDEIAGPGRMDLPTDWSPGGSGNAEAG